MGALTFRMLLILTFAVMAECARPLQSTQMSLLVMSLLQTPLKPLRPPPLSPVQREQLYQARQPPTAPSSEEYLHRGYRFGSPSIHRSATASSSEASSTTSVDSMSEVRYWSFQQLHKNPAGPNPIGNEFRPGNTKTAAKKNRYPPPYGG